ncbi:hypothetical protein M9H77_04123 [Catharanthus roseus]|uniref:Uncharacterized protein n=1 Tax=Catharanthus roseus TaxID=4058 RepID=A0ACC0CD84_CATRO|nr:hypothetical protein M9H77_04123 [Catharanthus roseus]
MCIGLGLIHVKDWDAWDNRASIQIMDMMGNIRKKERSSSDGGRRELHTCIWRWIEANSSESSRAPSCRGLAPIRSCCADMLRKMEATFFNISYAFGEYMRVAMGTGASTSSPPAPAVDSKVPNPDVPVRSSSTPSISIRALGTDDAPTLQ